MGHRATENGVGDGLPRHEFPKESMQADARTSTCDRPIDVVLAVSSDAREISKPVDFEGGQANELAR